eukprot:gene65211-89222_t
MKVTRGQIISRGLANCCPNCGAPSLFPPGAHFTINRTCASCDMKLSRTDGFYLGPLVINYTLTVAFVIVPLILLFAFDVIGSRTAIVLCGTGAAKDAGGAAPAKDKGA